MRIGHFRQVVPDSLLFSWEMLTADSPLAGCELVIEQVPAVVHCRSCGADTTLDLPVMACSSCAGHDVDLVTGDEFQLASFNLSARSVPESATLMGRFHRHSDGTAHAHGHDADHEADVDHLHRDVGDHSGYLETGSQRVEVLESILSENDRVAAVNQSDLSANGVWTLNLMSSPGAGKTTLLKRTLAGLGESLRCRRAGG